MSDIQIARNIRAGHKGHLRRNLDRLSASISAFDNLSKPSPLDYAALGSSLQRAADSLAKFDAAHLSVLAIEPLIDSTADSDEDFLSDMEDQLFRFDLAVRDRLGQLPTVPTLADPSTLTPPFATTLGPLPPLARQPVKPPPVLDADIDLKRFIEWLELWYNYVHIIDLSSQPHERQLATFWGACSPGFLNMLRRVLDLDRSTPKPLESIFAEIKAHLRSKRNANLDWQAFLSLRQQPGQTVDNFYASLMEQSDYADVSHVTPDTLRTAVLVLGLRDADIKRKVLAKHPTLNLLQTLRFVQTEESAASNVKILTTPSTPSSIAAVRPGIKTSSPPKPKPSPPSRPTSLGPATGASSPAALESNATPSTAAHPCSQCGFTFHRYGVCPATNSTCKYCHERGHYLRQCPTRPPSKPATPANSSHVNILCGSISCLPTISVGVCLHDQFLASVLAIPDTGALGTVAGSDILSLLGKSALDLDRPSDSVYTDINNKPLRQLGTLQLTFTLNDRHATALVVFCHHVEGLYLSLDVCKQLSLVHSNFPFSPVLSPLDTAAPAIATVASDAPVDPPVFSLADRRHWLHSLPTDPSPAQVRADVAKLKAVYQSVFACDDELRLMAGPIIGDPMRIELKPDAIPFAVHTARQIPLAHRDNTKKELARLELLGVIAPVVDEPLEWCHPLVVVPKPNGTVRLCVDLTKLNKQVHRTLHPTNTPATAVANIAKSSKFFTLLDAKHGYWQLGLHPSSQKLTTFITPWGRYKFLRAPMGFISTGDSYCLRGDLALQGLTHVNKVVDDILLDADSYATLMDRTCDVFERCARYSITLNADKCFFAQSEINFVGFHVTPAGYTADPQKVKAIVAFPQPTNRTELRSFLGLVNQLGMFTPDISTAADPLRGLLQTRNTFVWLADHTAAFNRVKTALTSPPVLAIFDPSVETVLQTDASKTRGLGFALLQNTEIRGDWSNAALAFSRPQKAGMQ